MPVLLEADLSMLTAIRRLFSAPALPPSNPPPPDTQPSVESDAPPPPAKEKKNKGPRARVANRVPVDTETLVTLKRAGKSYREIAEITGGNKDVINRKIKDLLPTEETEQYKSHRADILAELQRKLLVGIDEEALKKSTPYQRIGSAALLMDKERAERGQPGIIIGHGVALSAPLQEAVDRIIERLSPLPQVVEGNNANDIEDVETNVL